MAEFVDIIKIIKRVCNKKCTECPISSYNNAHYVGCTEFVLKHPEKAEKILLKWAKDHPEPTYPTWEQAWNQLYPEAARATPCPRCLFSTEMWPWCNYASGCSECMGRAISQEIAEKLGIKLLPAKEE